MRTLYRSWLVPCLLLLATATTVGGCAVVYRAGMEVFYHKEPLPASRTVADVAYWEHPDADAEKHRLDLYLPVGEGWPTVVFVHGGGWRTGDKNLRFGGADIYANIGRYLARRGIGAAVINYRLLPHVTVPEQFADVARAVAWVHRHVGDRGGDPARLFLMGHSAGAHLISRVAFDPALLDAYGLTPEAVCGVVAVSGAAYDLIDEETYADGSLSYFEKRFGSLADWRRAVSTLPFVTPDAPPFLILYGGKETHGLQRQSQLLDAALGRAGVLSEVVVAPGQTHARILLALSRDDKTAGPEVVEFVRSTACE